MQNPLSIFLIQLMATHMDAGFRDSDGTVSREEVLVFGSGWLPLLRPGSQELPTVLAEGDEGWRIYWKTILDLKHC